MNIFSIIIYWTEQLTFQNTLWNIFLFKQTCYNKVYYKAIHFFLTEEEPYNLIQHQKHFFIMVQPIRSHYMKIITLNIFLSSFIIFVLKMHRMVVVFRGDYCRNLVRGHNSSCIQQVHRHVTPMNLTSAKFLNKTLCPSTFELL